MTLARGLHRVPPVRPNFGLRAETLRGRANSFDLVVDLGQRIGSVEWLRGFVTCFGLCYAAWSLAPGFEPLPGAVPAPLPDAQFAEARTLAIAPLAYGGDTGRRMAPTDAVEPLTETPSGRSSTCAPPWAAATISRACWSGPESPRPRPRRPPL